MSVVREQMTTKQKDAASIADRPLGREVQVVGVGPRGAERGEGAPASDALRGVQGSPRLINDDKIKDECGVFGIFGHPEAANLTYLGLYALQHRGQESAGIAASDGAEVRISKAMGHVADAFSEK